ncbi:MAG: Gx transporter family protein [Bacilli bacterium]|jgi:heptaprenyl diphosphate synthase|nr:Gx transporter family protein [Bacilli bacterium]HHU24094.1 Gx transporter family protein [Acholeplasmataceae bacterium]
MHPDKKIKNTIIIALFIALGAVFSYFDGIISSAILSLMGPVAFLVPNFKFGFANIVILILLYNYKFKECVFAIFLKTMLVALILGRGPLNFILSLSGSMLSFFGMWFLKKLLPGVKNMTFVSAMGGFLHIIGQLGAIFLILDPANFETILIYSPTFILSGFLTGILVGILTKKVNASVIQHLQND